MMRSVNRKTTLNNNRHNQLVVTRQKWSEPDIILVEGFFYFFSYLCVGWGCQILTPSPFNLSCCCCSFSPFCLSPSLSQSLSLPTLRSRLLGFLAEHRDRRKKKKKIEGRIYEGHPCWSVQPSTSLQITHTLCVDSKQSCGSHSQQGCDHGTLYCQSVTATGGRSDPRC